jgi:DNA polymerase V
MSTRVLKVMQIKEQSIAEDTILFSSKPMAGFPVPGDDMIEASLNLHDYVIKNPSASFFVRVEGDSMEGVGIYSGDVLVVDRSLEVVPGRIVVAVIDGGLVVKQLQKHNGQMMLCSANDAYAPIPLQGDTDCYVWGVVTASARRFI